MRLLLTIFICIALSACSTKKEVHSPKGYAVDTGIIAEVEEAMAESNEEVLLGMRMYIDDSLYFDNLDTGKKLEAMVFTQFEGDTLNMFCFLGIAAKLGCNLKLYGDTCETHFVISSDAMIYKYKKEETALLFSLWVPCTQKSVVLSKGSEFKPGDTIIGKVELSSEPFWEQSNGKEEHGQVDLKVYFKTKI